MKAKVPTLDYDIDTRRRYQEPQDAARYDGYLRGAGLRSLRSRLVAWHEQRLVRKALRRIPAMSGGGRLGRLADIPCGTGKLAGVLSELRAPVVGGDISPAMIAIARQHAAGRLHRFVRHDIVACPFRNGAFRCVISLRLMHRVPSDVRAAMLAEIARTSDGYAIVSYGVINALQHARDRIRALFVSPLPYRRLAVEPAELTEELQHAGFDIQARFSVLWGLSREVIVLAAKWP
jgi:SAM-dependent methyltransferase